MVVADVLDAPDVLVVPDVLDEPDVPDVLDELDELDVLVVLLGVCVVVFLERSAVSRFTSVLNCPALRAEDTLRLPFAVRVTRRSNELSG